ncbi:MAG: hypothetical protein EA351_10760 [Gemmatimonadales bacterium]|nr:MAG: hypothetical protein EA351_10760 [Gemmatimonadales bacterium]
MSRSILPFLTLALAAIALPEGVEASEPGAIDFVPQAAEDTRWLPWIGCWEPSDVSANAEGSDLLVCFEPTDQGVRVLTLGDGEVLGEEHIVADGRPVPTADGGCEGTREARWSDDGRRAFVLSDLNCAEGVDRVTRGVFAMADEGREWLEIHGVRSADRDQTMAVRAFRTASRATLERHDVTPAGTERNLAIQTSRLAASDALDRDDLIEAVSVIGSEVTAALVAEMREPYRLDAATLKGHASAGVPGEVIDMMIAVSYPNRFMIDAGEAQAVPARAVDSRRDAYPPRSAYYGPSTRCPTWDRFCWDLRYRSMYGYYGSPGYAFGGGYGWGYRGPRYIIYQPGTVRGSGGSVNPGQGYRAPINRVRPAVPQSGPSETRPASSQGLGSVINRLRPSRSGSSQGSSGGSRVNPDSGHSSGGSSGRTTRPTRTSGGGGDG